MDVANQESTELVPFELKIADDRDVEIACLKPAEDGDARKVMDKLNDKFNAIEAFSAHFVQTLDAEFAGSNSTVGGTIILSDKKYRIETGGQQNRCP